MHPSMSAQFGVHGLGEWCVIRIARWESQPQKRMKAKMSGSSRVIIGRQLGDESLQLGLLPFYHLGVTWMVKRHGATCPAIESIAKPR